MVAADHIRAPQPRTLTADERSMIAARQAAQRDKHAHLQGANLRLECLKLAVDGAGARGAEAITLAKEYMDYVQPAEVVTDPAA